MNFKRKLLIFLISFSIIIPINTLAYSKYLIPGGETIGIKMQSNGVFVVGFYSVNGKNIAEESKLKIGDRIVSINDIEIKNINDLISNFDSSDEFINIKFGYVRNNKLNYTNLKLKKDQNGGYKTGIYVKDYITGIGTLTYIDPSTNEYGALGHEILESNSNNNFTLLNGKIFSSKITSITKSDLGNPGEKNGKLNQNDVYGSILLNHQTGIYGKFDKEISNKELIEVGKIDEVKIGKAEIITVLNDNEKEKFEIEILSIDKSNDTKNFLVMITDEKLLAKTGGIVRGMSGSPIIQNGKIIGAINHAIVDNPKKGYGISIKMKIHISEICLWIMFLIL